MNIALECKVEWCEKLLSGEKTVECRQYPLPAELYNKPLLLIGTRGADGVASLGDHTEPGSNLGSILGWVSFSECSTYTSLESFNSDQARHCVAPDSTYAWSGDQVIYGWVVGAYGKFDQPQNSLPALERLHRSLHKVID